MVPVTVCGPAMVAVQVLVSAVQEPSGAMVKVVRLVTSNEMASACWPLVS
jgi:hypothetical protein